MSDSTDDRTGNRLRNALPGLNRNVGITIGPAGAWLVFFVLTPMIFLVVVSFTTTDASFNIIWEPKLVNYQDLLVNDGTISLDTPFARSLLLSYMIAGATTVTTLIVAFPVSYFLARRSGTFVKVMMFLLLVPFFSVYIVRMYAWLKLFGSGGTANNILLTIGLLEQPHAIFDYGIAPTIVALTHAFIPYMLLTLYASLDGVDFSLVEAARDLGASRLQAFREIVLPLISSGIVTGVVFVFVPALGAYLAPQFLAKGQFYMIGQMIVNRVYVGYSIGYGSAMSVFIILAVIATLFLLYRVSGVDEFVQR